MKDFRTMAVSAADAFITKPEIKVPTESVPKKPDYRYIETKSKRAQLLIQPSIYKAAVESAESQGISFNEYVSQLIKKSLNIED